GLSAIEEELTSEKLADVLKSLRRALVSVHLPKFKVEMKRPFVLNAPLKNLGMEDAFQDGRADFSGMSGSRETVYIFLVLHKAFVDVNEEGTEAAAATALVVAKPKSAKPPPQPKVFRADHPFLYLIRDHQTGSVLFMGRLTEPSS